MAIISHKPESSSVINIIAWDTVNCNLLVVFHSGSIWMYSDVPTEIYENLVKANSLGSFFNKNIRDVYQSSKIGSLYDSVSNKGNNIGKEKEEEV